MPVQKAQFHRLKHIASQLKENRYPNAVSLVEDFRRIALEEELPIQCSLKTVQRDIQTLRNEFQCPLAYDRVQNGYYLQHHGWDFIAPALLDENEMLAAVIGARISEAIFPPPLKNKIRDAVDFLLQSNNPDFLDTANINSLSILSGLYINLEPSVFMTVFSGWQNRQCIRISYADYSGQETERVFEPHTLVFYQNNWYSKGFCHLKKAPRTFALQRIRRAELLVRFFTPDKTILASVNTDDFLGFGKIKKIRMKVNDHVRERLIAAPLHSQQKILQDNTVEIPAVSREVLFPFLLSLQGQAVLLAPAELKEDFKAELGRMLARYS